MKKRIVIISDTHNYHLQIEDIPDGDFLIHCGDATIEGTQNEIDDFLSWFSWLPHKYKIYVPGNHDEILYQKQLSFPFINIPEGIIYLEGKAIELDGVKIYGAPWRPRPSWAKPNKPGRYSAFGVMPDLIRKEWNKIPEELDILITHVPPFGILDEFDGINYGCPSLRDRVFEARPRIHCFGHVHTGYGEKTIKRTKFINAAICDDCYDPNREPIVIDLEM